MASLPEPDDLTSLVLRTDFSDDTAWAALKAVIDSQDTCRSATYVSDSGYAEVSVQALVDIDAAASEDEKLTYVFLADATTMTDEERPLLAVDLYTEPGRTFRLPPPWYVDVRQPIQRNQVPGHQPNARPAEPTRPRPRRCQSW
jgi:hypothetical protein